MIEFHIRADAGRECCSCQATNVPLVLSRDGSYVQHQHCELCYCTLAGSYCGVYDHAQTVMRHINLVANLLLAKLEKAA